MSADLTELSRTLVTVVCAGAKTLLDPPLTCERLETLGVPVIGYGSNEISAFFLRHSGLKADFRADSLQDAAAFTKVHFARLELANDDSLVLYDGNGNRVQTFDERTRLADFWSDDVLGRVVKVELNADGYHGEGWGFRIGDIAPRAEEKPVPAFVTSVRVRVGQPGDLWLNNDYLGRASAPANISSGRHATR